jgi:hypothetical protein
VVQKDVASNGVLWRWRGDDYSTGYIYCHFISAWSRVLPGGIPCFASYNRTGHRPNQSAHELGWADDRNGSLRSYKLAGCQSQIPCVLCTDDGS